MRDRTSETVYLAENTTLDPVKNGVHRFSMGILVEGFLGCAVLEFGELCAKPADSFLLAAKDPHGALPQSRGGRGYIHESILTRLSNKGTESFTLGLCVKLSVGSCCFSIRWRGRRASILSAGGNT